MSETDEAEQFIDAAYEDFVQRRAEDEELPALSYVLGSPTLAKVVLTGSVIMEPPGEEPFAMMLRADGAVIGSRPERAVADAANEALKRWALVVADKQAEVLASVDSNNNTLLYVASRPWDFPQTWTGAVVDAMFGHLYMLLAGDPDQRSWFDVNLGQVRRWYQLPFPLVVAPYNWQEQL